ncbi:MULTISPECIES: YaaR family protein [Geomicrobium]|uniref:Uncharacterized protein YaaR (DUF327 family) n=1 Tax=Geomicrobium sediminis TaxID=1347788 RepID=A0ABS2PDW2_9BACL|nr:YaaR family protein [Geomicrobium sp. JCM 19038]MBM7633620.1 uncharacterized protein YaaR (DUF327 family) [Geomicrobium sediminis]GAK06564.1 hypothetical protein JCM19038_266 [Geomicrobium sp. JCM 19038]
MEIDQLNRKTQIDYPRNKKAKVASDGRATNFKQMLEVKHNNHSREQLKEQLREIERQGYRLHEQQTLQQLKRYQKLVQSYISVVVQDGYELQQRFGLSHNGHSKQYTIVSQINDAVTLLGEEVLHQEDRRLHILEQVDYIRGLLLDLHG